MAATDRLQVPQTPSRRWRRSFLLILGILLALWGLRILSTTPSNDRDWSPDQAKLPEVRYLDSNHVEVSNIRNARYRTSQDYDLRWETRRYDLQQVDSLWYVVEPFADWRGPAHTFLSFGFANGEYLAVSVEIRKERGESFSPLRGLFRSYEITYVLGDERDLIGLRANIRKDDVYLYRVNATPAQTQKLLRAMLSRTEALRTKPEFYNTLTNSCTSNIVDHVNAIWPGRIPWNHRVVLPALSDDLAYEIGLIDTRLPAATFRALHQINDLAATYASAEDFSKRIRGRVALTAPQSGEGR